MAVEKIPCLYDRNPTLPRGNCGTEQVQRIRNGHLWDYRNRMQDCYTKRIIEIRLQQTCIGVFLKNQPNPNIQ